MNCIARKLLPLLLLSSCAEYSVKAMNLEVATSKNMTKEELMDGFKGLPKNLKSHIVSLLIQRSLWGFKLSKKFTLGGNPSSVSFSSDGKSFLIGHFDNGVAELWNVETGDLLKQFRADTDSIDAVLVSPSGESCITGATKGFIFTWNSKTGKLLNCVEIGSYKFDILAFSPDGERFVSGCVDHKGRVGKVVKEELLTTFPEDPTSDWISSIAFSSNGESCLTGLNDGSAYAWNSKTGEMLATFSGHTGPVYSVAFSSDGERVVTGSRDRTARVWNSKGELLLTLKGHTSSVYSATFSPDGELCLTGSFDHTARVWNSKTGELLTTLRGHEQAIGSVAWSPDGEVCVTAADNNTACTWKRAYGSSYVTPENKKIAFEYFITWYPLMEEPVLEASELLRKEVGPADKGSLSDEPVVDRDPSSEKDPCDDAVKASNPEQGPTESEPLAANEIGRGLDINSGDQKNCVIS